jgi:uncharacterized protein with HEPN domain
VQLGVTTFLQDDVRQDAVISCLEIIGEAARYVPDEVRAKAPEMPWGAIVATRHILAHHYSRVDLETVWRVASERLPATIESLRKLLASE